MTVTELRRRGSGIPRDPGAGVPKGAGDPQGRDGAAVPRWRPSRAGIVNVWRYYGETFGFHNGRLLLRGPNGVGKSKALELLLPYLLDANLRPNRLSTFGSADRTMHWNLMGEGADGTTRVGYVWLEFVRDGEWFTCGARLQASTHTTNVGADYFTTTRRIDMADGMSLLSADGRPLARAALAEAIGDTGRLYGSAGEYRAAVRKTLFDPLTEQRYDALITALLQLRTPKLSERLDPAMLSVLLSRALPAIGQVEIAELAEGFERLDRQRERMHELDREVDAAQTLANRQRGYAQRVLRAAAAALISATSELDKLGRAARRSQQRYERTVAERAEAAERAAELEAESHELRARIEGLTDSESYRRGGELDRLRRQADAATALAAQAADQASRQRAAADGDERAADQAERVLARQAAGTADAAEDARQAAEHAGMASTYAEVHAAAETGGRPLRAAAETGGQPRQLSGAAAETGGQPRQLLRAAVDSRQHQIATVRHVLDRHATAVRDRQRAERELEAGREALAAATAARDAAEAEHDRLLTELAGALRVWAERCVELTIADPDALVGCAGSEPTVVEQVNAAARIAFDQLAADRIAVEGRRAAAATERDRLRAQHDALMNHAELPPETPHTRTADRSTMAGAPLWKLVTFRDGTDAAVQAAVEAALEASGLLDAWVSPDGRLAVPGHDTFLNPDTAAPVPASAGSLAEVLDAEADCEVPADRVRRLLAGIAYGPTAPTGHAAAIGADGSWRLALVHGSWAKPDAVHIGAAARDRARQRRIAELAASVAELDATIGNLDAQLARLAARRHAVEAELRARPDHDGVRAAREALDRAESAVAARDDAVRRGLAAVQAGQREVTITLHALTELAAEHRLPTDADALDRVRTATDTLRRLGDLWLDRHRDLLAATEVARTARATAQRSAVLATELTAAADERDAEARRLRAAVDAVQGSVGADYRRVVDEVSELRAAVHEREAEARALNARLMELATSIGSLGTQREVDTDRRDSAVAARDAAAARFRHLMSTTLPADAGLPPAPSTVDGTKAVLQAARGVAAALDGVSYDAKSVRDAESRLTDVVHTCRQLLANRAELLIEADEDVRMFSAAADGVRIGAAELLDGLRTDRDRAQGDITDAERELFDQTLTGDTRRHLAARIRQASELVAAMNARLERVRTASKVAVRLVWQVDPQLPPGTRAARELLLKDPAQLTDADRDALHRFFRDRVDEARAADTAENWEQQLLQVFDYTRWHRFDVKVDRGGGGNWQLLTKKLHGALSGGEKAIVLHLPLFAAVAAHYQSAPAAPRLILLDEVFVGVDATNRGQVFGLLASLDLDLMLTSDHEWCTYRELDGIAIHQLITGGDGDDAVTTARFVWDGGRLRADEDGVPA